MRFAIFGTGGAGGYFGSQLALAGQHVAFIARGNHLRAMQSNGLRIETPAGNAVIFPVDATDDPACVSDVDAILIGVKAWQVTEAAHAIQPALGPDTCVVPLQNGVEASAQLASVLGRERVLGGLCGTLTWIEGPGHLRNAGGRNFVKFGELDRRRSKRVERLRQAFAEAGINVEVPSDIVKSTWTKFLFVASFGGIGAVTHAPVEIARMIPQTRRLFERCMEEVVAVGRALGVDIDEAAVSASMKMLDTLPPGATASLQRDIAGGRPSELDWWNGAVVRLGRQAGIPTPTHEFIHSSLLPLELQARREADAGR